MVLFIILLVLVCFVLIFWAYFNICLKKEVEVVNDIHNSFITYDETNSRSKDLISDVIRRFNNTYISVSDLSEIKRDYVSIYDNANSISKKLKILLRTPNSTIVDFIYQFENLQILIDNNNHNIINRRLDKHKDFFDHCLKYPLDNQQRRSIVSEEDNCLVISSAGSGKTSSIVGKVKYLIEILKIPPEKILLISYTNKAATELTERMNTSDLRGYTFHKLAIDIIAMTTGTKPSICDNTDKIFVHAFRKLLSEKKFRNSIISFFTDYQIPEEVWEINKKLRQQFLSEQKNLKIKALLPDMDGKNIIVRSEQENKICFALSVLGVKFRYEENYEYKVADELHSQYKPDFSIYYEKNGITKRVYLEHFATDEHGLVPSWFAKEKGITYEKANELYGDGITWKKDVHKKFGTTLISTSSADFNNNIQEKLKNILQNVGVPIYEKSNNELYEMIIPPSSEREKSTIRLVATFITLAKSSCQSIPNILKKAENAGDERSIHVIKNIIIPVATLYNRELHESHQIDFTDSILQATEICKKSHPVNYDYIIVDEFQDISIDRYNFLISLRSSNPTTKLFCVGDDWQSIYRFSGSDMALFSRFEDYFGPTEINKIETTYRFGEPLLKQSSKFIQRNGLQVKKNIHPFSSSIQSELVFQSYDRPSYCDVISRIIDTIPQDKSIFLLGRYSFDDYYLSFAFNSNKEGNQFFYTINDRKIEFLTIHKSKGLEADYVILLQCNKDSFGFPSQVNDDPILNYVLSRSDEYPYGEERRLFYVAITRAKNKTVVMYDKRFPSIFVDEFLHPEKVSDESKMVAHRNAQMRWTSGQDRLLLKLHSEGKSIKQISNIMGRSYTSIVMRLGKLGAKSPTK